MWNIAIFALILFLCFITSFGNVSAQEDYSDNFNIIDSTRWTAITSDTWQIINGTISSTGNRPGLIYENFDGTMYISEIDFMVNKTQIPNYAQIGFYPYYKDSDNYARAFFTDDNRGTSYSDQIGLEQKGPTVTNTQAIINTNINTSIELDPKEMHHLKVVRLNNKIYVYFDNQLALITEFKDENPSGKVGFDVYASTGYFDNFSLRPISMKNASGYIDKFNLSSANPTIRLGHYTLRFEGIEIGGDARFILSKYGNTVDTAYVRAGSTVTMNFENGDKGVEFKLRGAVNDSKNGIVQLEDIISASSESTSVGIDNITLLPEYHQNENMNISFSIVNPGKIGFNGTSSVTIESGGRRSMLYPDLNLGAGMSQNFQAVLKSPETPDVHKLTISLELDDDITVTKSVDYNVTMLNPVISTLSSDFIDDNGIKGTISFDSAIPDKFLEWNTNITMQIYRIVQNGRERTYFKNISVMKNKDYNIYVPYTDFYLYDGQYLVSITLGNMKNERLFEVKGPDGIYNPTDKSEIILVSDMINSQLILLLIGMIAALSIRNYKNQKSNVTIDTVITICGFIVFIAGIFHGWINMTVYGIFMTGLGLMLYFSRNNGARMEKLILLNTSLHDLAILIIVYLSMAYLILLIPEWNPILILGTLIGYYIIINITNESGSDSVVIPVESACPQSNMSKYLTEAGISSKVLIKLISVALAIIIILGIAWTFYPKVKEQPINIQPEVETSAVTGIPSVTEIPIVAETIVPTITPKGSITHISLDRHKILRGGSPSIKVGDEIIWINDGLDSITIVSDNIPGFGEEVLDVGKKTTPFMFTRPGTYTYYLKSNKNVNGTIKVI